MKAFTSNELDTQVWGLSVNPEWWEREWNSSDPYAQKYIQHLADWSPYMKGGPSCYAALVAGAIEEVKLWEKYGIEIKGHHWADLGGSNGYYAIALKVGGASKSTLIDGEPPSEWSKPVLEQADVEIQSRYLPVTNATNADSACILYVPDIDPINMLEETQTLRVLVTNEVDDNIVSELTSGGWTVEKIVIPKENYFFIMGEGCTAPGRRRSEDNILYVMRGKNKFSRT